MTWGQWARHVFNDMTTGITLLELVNDAISHSSRHTMDCIGVRSLTEAFLLRSGTIYWPFLPHLNERRLS